MLLQSFKPFSINFSSLYFVQTIQPAKKPNLFYIFFTRTFYNDPITQ